MNSIHKLCLLLFLFSANFVAAQDTIFLRNGNYFLAKVIEIASLEVKYKKMENLSGPLYSLQKYEIYKINFENGTSEVYGKLETPSPKNEDGVTILRITNDSKVDAKEIEEDNKKEKMDAITRYTKLAQEYRLKGIIFTALGYPMAIGGLAMVVVGFRSLVEDLPIGGNKYPSTGTQLGLIFGGIGCLGAGIPFSIVGPKNLADAHYYSKKAKEAKASLSFEPRVIPQSNMNGGRSMGAGLAFKINF